MKITIDGQPFTPPVRVQQIGDVIEQADIYLEGQKRGIVQVDLDGERVPLEDSDLAFVSEPAASRQSIDIHSRPSIELAREMVSDFDNVLPEFPDVCRAMAQVFHDVRSQEGYEELQLLLELWEHIALSQAQIARAVGLNPAVCRVASRTLVEHQETIERHLVEIADAMDENDRVLISDRLEYELAPLAEEVIEVFALFRERIAEQEDKTP